MRLATNVTGRDAAELARTAEQLGYDLVLVPEGYRSDAASVLGLVAASTSRIGLGSAVMQIPARPPGLTALTAATLDVLSEGRFRLGLGISNPDVSEGWYGVGFAEPLARIKEYIDIVRTALTGAPVTHQGKHFQLPSGERNSAPLHLMTDHPRSDLPIYLAAARSGSLRLAGETADGWIGVLTSPDGVESALGHVRAGRTARGYSMAGFDSLISLPTAVADDVETGMAMLREHYAYLMSIGHRDQNLYCAMARELGFAAQVAEFRDVTESSGMTAAAAAVPEGFIDQTALVGSVTRVAERMRSYHLAGVTTLSIMVSSAHTNLEGRQRILRGVADAFELAGLS